jgi:hypothetical protein
MEWSDFLVFFTPALIGGLVASAITLIIAGKRIMIKNVTIERKNWRNDIRQLASEIVKELVKKEPSQNAITELRCRLRCKLNPYDTKDISIIECVQVWPPHCRARMAERFAALVSLLLKHDWERAKEEAAFLSTPFCPPIRLDLTVLTAKHSSYKKFEALCTESEYSESEAEKKDS